MLLILYSLNTKSFKSFFFTVLPHISQKHDFLYSSDTFVLCKWKRREAAGEKRHSCLYVSTGHTCDYMLSALSLTTITQDTHSFSLSHSQTYTNTHTKTHSCSQRWANSYTQSSDFLRFSHSLIHVHKKTHSRCLSTSQTMKEPCHTACQLQVGVINSYVYCSFCLRVNVFVTLQKTWD